MRQNDRDFSEIYRWLNPAMPSITGKKRLGAKGSSEWSRLADSHLALPGLDYEMVKSFSINTAKCRYFHKIFCGNLWLTMFFFVFFLEGLADRWLKLLDLLWAPRTQTAPAWYIPGDVTVALAATANHMPPFNSCISRIVAGLQLVCGAARCCRAITCTRATHPLPVFWKNKMRHINTQM